MGKTNIHYHTPCSGFRYETHIGISPYHTLDVVGTATDSGYDMHDLIVSENINAVHFPCDMEKCDTCPMDKDIGRVLYFAISH